MSQVRMADRVMAQMAERADTWCAELKELIGGGDVGTAEERWLNATYVELSVASTALKEAARHIDFARTMRRKAIEARRPPQNPPSAKFPPWKESA